MAIRCQSIINQLIKVVFVRWTLDAMVAEGSLQVLKISKISIVKFAGMTTAKTACG
jgi:hypothetical protein